MFKYFYKKTVKIRKKIKQTNLYFVKLKLLFLQKIRDSCLGELKGQKHWQKMKIPTYDFAGNVFKIIQVEKKLKSNIPSSSFQK